MKQAGKALCKRSFLMSLLKTEEVEKTKPPPKLLDLGFFSLFPYCFHVCLGRSNPQVTPWLLLLLAYLCLAPVQIILSRQAPTVQPSSSSGFPAKPGCCVASAAAAACNDESGCLERNIKRRRRQRRQNPTAVLLLLDGEGPIREGRAVSKASR